MKNQARLRIPHTLYEPQHNKTNKMAIAPSEDSDQPWLCALRIAKDLRLLRAHNEDADQTGRMPILI